MAGRMSNSKHILATSIVTHDETRFQNRNCSIHLVLLHMQCTNNLTIPSSRTDSKLNIPIADHVVS